MSETEDYNKSATPTAHASTHEDGGSDEISVDGLAGELVNDQPSTWTMVSGKPTTFAPAAHKTSHQDTGADEISVAGLSGTLADPQTPAAHKTSHQDTGADEISVAGLSGELTDLQKPKDHTHQSAGSGVGGKIDHGLALDGLADDDHTQYIKHALATAESDFLAASGAGAFVKKTLAETKTILGIEAGGDPGEGHITILPWLYTTIIQGTWAATASSGQILYGYLRNNTHDDGDQLNFKVYLAAGTYTFSLIGQKDTDCGIIEILIDTVSKGTIDTYGSAANNVRFDVAGIVVATSGLKTFSLKVNGKNTSSSNHYVYLTAMALTRTA